MFAYCYPYVLVVRISGFHPSGSGLMAVIGMKNIFLLHCFQVLCHNLTELTSFLGVVKMYIPTPGIEPGPPG